jgi:hypothetical protein
LRNSRRNGWGKSKSSHAQSIARSVLRLYWIGKSIRCFFGLMLILMHLLCKRTCLMYSSSVGWLVG